MNKKIDWAAVRAEVEAQMIADTSAAILANPDEYECPACYIEGQRCDVGLAVRVERERIIKLLENEKFILPEGIDEGMTLMPIQEAIARIKGEYK